MDAEDRAHLNLEVPGDCLTAASLNGIEEGEGGADCDDDLQSTGHAEPDHEPDQLVRLPNLLAAAASRQLRIDMKRLAPGPVFSFLDDSWRSREQSDLWIFMLRLQLCRQVLKQKSTELQELYSGFEGSRHASLEVDIPASGYELHRVHTQLTGRSFETFLKGNPDDHWAFLGPGNSGPDGWLILRICQERRESKQKYLILWLQSKKRSGHPPPLLTEKSIEQERRKAFKVSEGLAVTTMLFVTDQEAKDLPMVVDTPSGESIVVDCSRQHQYYSAVSFIKVALLKANGKCKDWPGKFQRSFGKHKHFSHLRHMHMVTDDCFVNSAAQKPEQQCKLLFLCAASTWAR